MLPVLPADVDSGGLVHLEPSLPIKLDPIQLEYYAALGVNTSRLSQYSILQRAELANLWYSSPVYARHSSARSASDPTPFACSASEPTPFAFMTSATSCGEPTPLACMTSASSCGEPTPANHYLRSPPATITSAGEATAAAAGEAAAAAATAVADESTPLAFMPSAPAFVSPRPFLTSTPPPALRALSTQHVPIRDVHETWHFVERSAIFRRLVTDIPALFPVANFTRVRADFDTEKIQGEILSVLSSNQLLWISRLAACATNLSAFGRANLTIDEFFNCLVNDSTLHAFQLRLEQVHTESGLTAQTIRKGFFCLQEAIRGVCGHSLSLIQPELMPLAKRSQAVISDLAGRWSARAVMDLNETEVKKMTVVSEIGARDRTYECGVALYVLALCLLSRLMDILDGQRHRTLSEELLQEATSITYFLAIMARPLSRAGVLLELELSHCVDKFRLGSETFIFLGKHKLASSVGALCLAFPAWLSGAMHLYLAIVRPALQQSGLWKKAATCRLFPQEVSGWLGQLLQRYAGLSITVSQIRKVFCLYVGGMALSDPRRNIMIGAAGHKANGAEDTATTAKFYHSAAKAETERSVMSFLDETFYQIALTRYHNILLDVDPGPRTPLFQDAAVSPAVSPSPTTSLSRKKKKRRLQVAPVLVPSDDEVLESKDDSAVLTPLLPASPCLLFASQEAVEDLSLSVPTTALLSRHQVTVAAAAANDATAAHAFLSSAAVVSAPDLQGSSASDTDTTSVTSARKCRNSQRSHKCHSAGLPRHFATDVQLNCDACVRANGGAGNAKRKRTVKES